MCCRETWRWCMGEHGLYRICTLTLARRSCLFLANTAAHTKRAGKTQKLFNQSIKKPRIIIILPTQTLRPPTISLLRLLQHFHTRFAQLLLHALRHLRPHLVGEIREARRPGLLHGRRSTCCGVCVAYRRRRTRLTGCGCWCWKLR